MFRKRDADGEEKKRYELPLLNEAYANHDWYGLSPGGTRIAYWSGKANRLRLRSLQGAEDKVLLTVPRDKRSSEAPRLRLVAWRDRQTVVFVSNPGIDGYDYHDIYKVSVGGSVVRARVSYSMVPDIMLSPDGRYICGAVKNTFKPNPDRSKGWQALVFDLDTMKVRGRSSWSKARRHIGAITWSGDNRSCFLVENGLPDDKSAIVEYRLSDSSLTRILMGPNLEMRVGIDSDGRIIMGERGEWKLYDYRKKSWGQTVRLDASIIGAIPGTTRWILSDW